MTEDADKRFNGLNLRAGIKVRKLLTELGIRTEDAECNLRGVSEPEFYGDLVYKFKKIVGRADFSDQFRKIIVRYKRIGYNINIMRQSACLVFNPITVNNFASLFNCTPVGRASDSMMAPT